MTSLYNIIINTQLNIQPSAAGTVSAAGEFTTGPVFGKHNPEMVELYNVPTVNSPTDAGVPEPNIFVDALNKPLPLPALVDTVEPKVNRPEGANDDAAVGGLAVLTTDKLAAFANSSVA